VSEPATELADLVAHRVAWLTDYQDEAFAGRYKAWVDRVRAAEEAAGASTAGSLRLSLAVARQLFRLMAIKDEYEVARLLTSERFRQQLEGQFEGEWRLVFHLAPPALGEASGEASGAAQGRGQRVAKRAFGEAWQPVLQGLAKARRWRNTWLDPLRWSATRRDELAMLAEYEQLLEGVLAGLNAANHAEACELAESAEAIRGFGQVRAANAAPVRARWAQRFLLQSRP
jgi:indolepyruvate ferredoxin oxidoreductase